jgi:hypothetical protein
MKRDFDDDFDGGIAKTRLFTKEKLSTKLYI